MIRMFVYVFALLSLIFNLAMGYFVSAKRAEGPRGDKIYDVGFNVLPDLSKYEYINDIMLTVPLLFVVMSWSKWSLDKRTTMVLMLGMMYLFRCVALYVTTYPSPKECKIRPPFGFCNDHMFSGHTAFNIVTSYFVGKPLWPVWPMITSVMSVATRDHYTADVVIAWLIFAALKCNV